MLSTFLRAGQRLVALHYFTALVSGTGGARQQTYLDALTANSPLTQVHRGRFQRKDMECRACGSRWTTHEEKESDVSLAVQMVADAATDVYDEAFIVSGDSDMAPALKAVRAMRPDVRLIAIFPPHRSSTVLRERADLALSIFDKVPRRHQLPEIGAGAGHGDQRRVRAGAGLSDTV